jgi:peptidoglycan/LPS O-acetylase OafA/YrhL
VAEIRALTGLRGVAACSVVAYHVTRWGIDAPAAIGPFVRHGYLAVDLFFVLSGFLMARRYGGSFPGGARVYAWFLARRLQRIYPMYAVAIAATFGLYWAGALPLPRHGGGSAAKFVMDMAMLQCLGGGPNLLPVSWSLSTEWIAYLTFPLLAFLVLRLGPLGTAFCGVVAFAVILALCALPAAWSHIFIGAMRRAWLDLADTTTPWPLLRCLADFTIGMVASRTGWLWRPRRIAGQGAAWVIVLICAGLPWTTFADVAAVPCFAGLVVVLAHEDGRFSPAHAFAFLPLYGIGVVSYALYLTHELVWVFLLRSVHGLTAAPLSALAPALLVASICYWMIERPGRRLLPHMLQTGARPADL